MSMFKWTSPIRQNGLSPIPIEVFMEIFNYLRPPDCDPWISSVYRRDFSRVALVCRFFCSVMLPWIFESMTFAGKNSDGIALNYAPFCRSVIHGCGSARIMATYVKRCSLTDWVPDRYNSPSSWCNMEFQLLYSRALALMPNVEELRLMKTYIDKNLLKSIMELKCLTSLSLDYCTLLKTKDKHIRKLSTLRLKSFHFFESPWMVRTSVEISVISQSLCLDSLLTIRTNCWPLVTRIAEQNCNLPLRELDIVAVRDEDVVRDVELLPKIFQKTPALKKLRISSAGPSQRDVELDDLLPALDDVSCPVFLLKSLVPGRPISSIKITTSSLTELTDIQSLFKKSTHKIRSLCVPIHAYRTIPFWKHFPDLESLRVEVLDDRALTEQSSLELCLSEISGIWPHNPPIQELHVDFCFGPMGPLFDLELQNKIISTIVSPKFPHLRCMSVSDYIAWNKVPEDGVWKPSLHRISFSLFAERLRRGFMVKPIDYDNFLEQIRPTAKELW